MSFHVRRLQTEKKSRPRKVYKFALTVLPLIKPVFGWYQLWKERRENQQYRAKRIMLLKRLLLVMIAILIACVLMVGVVRALVSMDVLNVGTITSVAGAEIDRDENGYINLLLIGQGDDDHDGKDLTDTLIIASLDPDDTGSTVMLSIPRDTYFLDTDIMGAGRVNTFYRDYTSYLTHREGLDPDLAQDVALEELKDEIGRKFDLNIQHVVKVNFTAFTEAVDAIGGVEIEVQEDLLDTEYPNGNYGYETFAIKQGLHQLDGETALKYARSRHSTSDFSRSARQQQLLAAIAKKVKDEGLATDPGFITKMYQNMSNNVKSSLTLREMIGLAELGRKIDRERIITMQLNDQNGLYGGFIEAGGFLYTPPREEFGGASVLLPVSIPEFPVTWKQPQAFSELLFKNRELYLEPLTINVLNNGGPGGAATRLAVELMRYGFNVDEIANADLPAKQDQSVIISGAEDQVDKTTFLADLLSLQIDAAPTELPPGQQADITIILGKDYVYKPIQNLLSNE